MKKKITNDFQNVSPGLRKDSPETAGKSTETPPAASGSNAAEDLRRTAGGDMTDAPAGPGGVRGAGPADRKTRILRAVAAAALALAVVGSLVYIVLKTVDSFRVHSAEDFGFHDLVSPCDADSDGIDDFADMVAGAREYIATDPVYRSAYFAGGYPDDGSGVCTDVIWHAFMSAGYVLKDMVDADIASDPGAYPDHSDSNIDFRRVRNLRVFFERNAQSLTLSTKDPSQWMPGDIAVFDGHIAICSDKRNAKGIPYLIHHGNDIVGAVEHDDMSLFEPVGHYRFYGNANDTE